MGKRILTVGEPIGLFIAQEEDRLDSIQNFSTSVAGAEFNVAIGLTRLEHKVGYLTKLGCDPFGKQILRVMNENGIDTSLTLTTEDSLTGFMLKSKTSQGDPDIYYYRKNSAAATMNVNDLGHIDMSQWDALHMTGIFPSISQSACEVSFHLMHAAREAGIPIFFDPNLRPQLWSSCEMMVVIINHLASLADYVLPGVKEGKILCGSDAPEAIGQFYLKAGAKTVVVKTGADGARTFLTDRAFHTRAYHPSRIVDTVGAGDGFAAGVISGILEGLSVEEAVLRGSAIGAIQIMNAGDNEGLPTRTELSCFQKENC